MRNKLIANEQVRFTVNTKELAGIMIFPDLPCCDMTVLAGGARLWNPEQKKRLPSSSICNPVPIVIPGLHSALDIPYCHHEKWDGLSARIERRADSFFRAAFCRCWTSLLSNRPYRPAWTEEQANEYIREQSGKHFEPLIVSIFLEMRDETYCP